jgi:hypothetical protein
LTLLQAMQRGVDLIAIVPIQSATSRLEIRRVLAALSSRCGRSPVVSTEGADSSPRDWGSVPEACEIGGLGTLVFLGLWDGLPVRVRCPVALVTEGDDLIGR